MAVSAQQDFHARPAGADRPHKPAQERLDLFAARSLGGTKNRGDESPLTVKHDNRLEAVFVVVRVEQRQLLTAVDGVEGVVKVERDAARRSCERG